MFVPQDYQNYKYLVDCSDNYYILSTSSSLSGSSGDPDTLNVIYQYINPSILTIESTYQSVESRRLPDISASFTDNVFDRADFPQIFVCNFICVLLVIFIFNNLSKFFYKGGVFGSN